MKPKNATLYEEYLLRAQNIVCNSLARYFLALQIKTEDAFSFGEIYKRIFTKSVGNDQLSTLKVVGLLFLDKVLQLRFVYKKLLQYSC